MDFFSNPQAVQRLTPKDDAQRAFKAQAAGLVSDIGQMRWLLFEQAESSLSVTLIGIMVFWLALTFLSVGVYAPANGAVIVAQLLAALSVSGAVYLIMELDQPFTGIVRIASDPMLNALSLLAK